MEWLAEYTMFLAKAFTFLVVVFLIVSLVALVKARNKREEGTLTVVRVNDQLLRMTEKLEQTILNKSALKSVLKARKAKAKAREKSTETGKRVFVLNFDGDLKASALDHLRHEVTAILELATDKDEVVVKVESGGGMVHAYGLAAAQLVRIREAGVPLTVCVDKVAASGGYMMACIGTKVLAAPFAILGSIGVVAQMPNFNRLLKKHNVDFEMLTAGEYKRTLTLFGENTEKGREKFQEDLENIHRLFKSFVGQYRPQLDVAAVATGEIWFGNEALEMALADEITTSDQYISRMVHEAEVFEVHYVLRKRLQDKLSAGVSVMLDRLMLTWLSRFHNQRFW